MAICKDARGLVLLAASAYGNVRGTYYSLYDDGKMSEWLYKTDIFEDNLVWACLSNPKLFNFRADWQRVHLRNHARGS